MHVRQQGLKTRICWETETDRAMHSGSDRNKNAPSPNGSAYEQRLERLFGEKKSLLILALGEKEMR